MRPPAAVSFTHQRRGARYRAPPHCGAKVVVFRAGWLALSSGTPSVWLLAWPNQSPAALRSPHRTNIAGDNSIVNTIIHLTVVSSHKLQLIAATANLDHGCAALAARRSRPRLSLTAGQGAPGPPASPVRSRPGRPAGPRSLAPFSRTHARSAPRYDARSPPSFCHLSGPASDDDGTDE
ncbi:hypothetical protein HDK77DRAFT_3864 [Phyllosticta capitalensis]